MVFSLKLNLSDNLTICYQQSVQGSSSQALFRYAFLPILILNLGNILNLVVYSHAFLRTSPTVRILAAKAAANFMACVILLPNFLYTSVYGGRMKAADASDTLAAFYWYSLKYILFAHNWFATISVWLTVAVIAEHWLLVVFPAKGRFWSNLRNAHFAIAAVIPASALLHSYPIISLYTKPFDCQVAGHAPQIVYYFLPALHQNNPYPLVYFWTNAITTIILPMILLSGLSLDIYHHMARSCQKFQTNTQQKQCVIKLAIATTICHLVFEMPQMMVFIFAAVYGSNTNGWRFQEEMVAGASFLSLINASIPFLVYIGCSKRFRQLTAQKLCCGATSASFAQQQNGASKTPAGGARFEMVNRLSKKNASKLPYGKRGEANRAQLPTELENMATPLLNPDVRRSAGDLGETQMSSVYL